MPSEPSSPPRPVSWLSALENRVLLQILAWDDQYRRELATFPPSRRRLIEPPTTDRCSKRFGLPHASMLALLNRLESYGFVEKRRRLSAGLSGYGYDGALYSAVTITEKGRLALGVAQESSTK